MIKQYKLLPLNQPNINGRIYTAESFVGRTLNKPFYPIAEYDDNPDICLEKVKGQITNLLMVDNFLVGDVMFIEPDRVFYEELLNDGCVVIRPKAIGNVDDNKVVTNAELLGFNFIPSNYDNYNFNTKE
jgi:hypothetical protein